MRDFAWPVLKGVRLPHPGRTGRTAASRGDDAADAAVTSCVLETDLRHDYAFLALRARVAECDIHRTRGGAS